MASSNPSPPLPTLTKTSAVRLVEGGVTVDSTLRAQGGFTVYKTLFKIKEQTSEGVPIIQQCEIWKRFSDFQQLSKQLEVVHAHSKSLSKLPVLVKAKYFERFKDSVIEERRRSAEALLQFASRYHHLASSSALQQFLAGSTTVGVVDLANPGSDSTAIGPSPDSQQSFNKQHSSVLKRNPSLLLEVDAIAQQLPFLQPTTDEEVLAVGTSLPTAAQGDQTDSNQPIGMSMDPRSQLDVEPSGSTRQLKVPPFSKRVAGPELSSNNSSATGSEENLASGSNVSLEISEIPEGLKTSASKERLKEATSLGLASDTAKPSVDGGAGMDWWAEAMAETQDFDALIEKMDSENTNGNSNADKQSLPESLDLQRPEKTPSQSAGKLKPAKSDSSLVSPDAESGGHKVLGHSHSERSVRDVSGSKGKVPSPQRRVSPAQTTSSAYVVQAGKLIKQALAYERSGDYEEAFDLFKAGVDVLLNGVQTDHNKHRREIVRKKTSEYLRHAEQLFQEHLAVKQKALNPAIATESSQPATAKPHLLPDFRVIGTIDKVILVESKHKPGQTYIFKVLYKSLMVMASVKKGRSKATKNRSPSQCPHMVKLLHHYETANHRIFLLLEYIKNGRLIDFVQTKRDQWNKLKAAAENPPPSSLLVSKRLKSQADRKQLSIDVPLADQGHSSINPEAPTANISQQKPLTIDSKEGLPRSGSLLADDASDTSNDQESTSGEDKESENGMERLLSELTSIVPPSKLPSSITSEDSEAVRQNNCEGGKEDGDADSESNKSDSDDADPANSVLDSLAILRKRFEETIDSNEAAPEEDHGSILKSSNESKNDCTPDTTSTSRSKEVDTTEQAAEAAEAEAESATAINILPPTPTVPPAQTPALGGTFTADTESDNSPPKNTTLSAEHARSNQTLDSTDGVQQQLADLSVSSTQSPSSSITIPGGARQGEREGSPGQGSSPHFSPASLRNSPDSSNKVDDWVQRLECSTRHWAAQIVLALEHLHYHNIVWRDFNKNNVLLDDSGNAVLTYFGKWDFVPPKDNFDLAEHLYVAPELRGLSEPSEAADWWSFGALLFEILTGETLASCHPDGLHTHLPLRIPLVLSPEAQSLLTQLLQVSPNERLGSGPAGVEELKAHPFFSDINWNYT